MRGEFVLYINHILLFHIIKYVKAEGLRVDYRQTTPNKKAIAPSLNFYSSTASTIMLRLFHDLAIARLKHLKY